MKTGNFPARLALFWVRLLAWTIEPLPYRIGAAAWLARLREQGFACLLESAGAPGGRFDVVAAAPRARVESCAGQTRVFCDGNTGADSTARATHMDPFAVVNQLLGDMKPACPCPLDLPFTGGAIGYFGYELGGSRRHRDLPLPDMAVGIFDVCIVLDHARRRSWLVATPDTPPVKLTAIRQARPVVAGEWQVWQAPVSNLDAGEYNEAIAAILRYIHAGDCYQVNFAQRFHARIEGDVLGLYGDIARRQQAAYSACLLTPAWQVLSFSPERFIRVEGNRVMTQPIKGTRPRGSNAREDRELAEALSNSEKDRAENLMIVDLLRNDLGRCCEPGSIKADKLFELASFRNVHHLVSTVSGRLRPGLGPLDMLRAAFPGGSITGAPKIRAMEIIEALEPVQRGPYCGAIGYIGFDGRMDTNLSIRTMACSGNDAWYWGGGGIVADSIAADEYAESLAKVDFIRQTLMRHRSVDAAQHTPS